MDTAGGRVAFSNLHTIGGVLRLADNFDDHGSLRVGTTGATPLTLQRGIELRSTLAHGVPLHEDAQIGTTGSVVIKDNDNLCQCQADTFLAELTAAGFTGTSDVTPNGTCTAPCTPRL